MGGTFGRLSSFIRGTERDLLPVIVKAGGTVDRVNDQLDKLDVVTDSAVSMADSADTAVRAVSTAITTPVKKVSGLAAGVAHGFSAFRARRDPGEAVRVAKDAAAQRESELDEELRRRGTRRRGRATAGRVAGPRDRSYTLGMRTTAELREGFLSFFEERGHLRCPSYVARPARRRRLDACSTSAGMQPQMPFFLGLEPPPALLTTTSQKCFRTVDIDEVGLDGHHLTFFEMLGNFSFGQYFKEGAIAFATEFVQERMKLDWDRVWVSVHAGDPELGLGPDQVAIDLWREIGMPRERIVPLPSSENFWSVGGPGRAGPTRRSTATGATSTAAASRDCAPSVHALRAVPRVLEPRLHGVRAARGRDR